jgi:hypothetical protein
MERFKKLANGPDSLPLDQELERIISEYPASGYDKTIDEVIQSLGLEKHCTAATRLRSALAVCNLHLRVCKTREACEMAIWGRPLPETTKEIDFFLQERQNAMRESFEGNTAIGA